MPVAGCGAEDEDARSRSQAVESVDYLAVRQCLLELVYAFVRDSGLEKVYFCQLIEPLEIL